jgi:hypothetical protein
LEVSTRRHFAKPPHPRRDLFAAPRVILESLLHDRVSLPSGVLSAAISQAPQGLLDDLDVGVIDVNAAHHGHDLANMIANRPFQASPGVN